MTTPKFITDSCCLVEVPDSAIKIHVHDFISDERPKLFQYSFKDVRLGAANIQLPPGKWSILTENSKQITEEQAKQIAPEPINGLFVNFYLGLLKPYNCKSALESFNSLLKANNLNPNVGYCVLIKNKEK